MSGIEIRRDDDELIDDVVARACDVQIERMDDARWFVQIGNEVFSLSHVRRNGKWHIDLTHTETRE